MADARTHLDALEAALAGGDHAHVLDLAEAVEETLAVAHEHAGEGPTATGAYRVGAFLGLRDRAARAVSRARSPATGPSAEIATRGTTGEGGALPHLERIQASFGRHDVRGIRAHVGGAAAEASGALGARAYAVGDAVGFASAPDLHTAAHEAAHVVQQRDGVQLAGGIDGGASDPHERHADAVADAVVRGESAEALLDTKRGGGGAQRAAVQRAPAQSPGGGSEPSVTPPKSGINKQGFIDNGDGANIRTGPAETGGQKVRDQPLPPATAVFVSGTHPDAPQWWYVTAFLDKQMVRGYVQDFRVTTDLPEPTAKLHQVVSGDTAEKLAVQEYSTAVRDGHDLRYYENVLLYVNRQAGRAGITGSYQDPGLLGGGANNVQLVAGHRIWLVSPAYAKALESVVPDGSLTGGAVAKVKRFLGHLRDILQSVTDSPSYFGQVAGEYAQAIRDHMAEIVGIVAGFITAEATSMFLAATPTGVGQAAAAVIQLALSAFGAAGAIEAGAVALQHASAWLTTAWTAKGDPAKIGAASIEFLKMLVSIAMAALSALGAKANYGNALKIASSMPTGMAPAMAVAGGGTRAGVGAGAGVAIGPTLSPAGATGAMMTKHDKDAGGSDGEGKDESPARDEKTEQKTDEQEAKKGSEQSGPAATKEPYRGSPGEEIDPGKITVFRGGDDFTFDSKDVKIKDGMVQKTHGLSLDTDPTVKAVATRGAKRVASIPPELRIIQRGARPTHFEIVPREPMSPERFQELLKQIVLE